MTKKKETSSKAKVVKEETEKEQAPKDAAIDSNQNVESTISNAMDEYTTEEEKSLKSKENQSDKKEGLSFEEADQLMSEGGTVKLPEWKGFWFKEIENPEQIYVLTKDGKIVDTPHDEYKSREDWEVAVPTADQSKLLSDFWLDKKTEKNAKKDHNAQENLKALYHARRQGGSFEPVTEKSTVKDLKKREKTSKGHSIESLYLLENGKVFSVRDNAVTNQDLSNQLEILKKQK